jgi:predicted transcriptional regulator
MGRSKKNTSFTISDEGGRLLVKLAEKGGVSRSAVIERAVRELAENQGIRDEPADATK